MARGNKKTRLSISTEPGFYFEIRCSELVVRDQPVWTSFIDVVLRSRFHKTRRPYVLIILRKEVIQPQVPLRLPCYDLVPIIELTLGTSPLAVSIATSGPPNFRGLTGGVYKAQEHIHRGMLTRDY